MTPDTVRDLIERLAEKRLRKPKAENRSLLDPSQVNLFGEKIDKEDIKHLNFNTKITLQNLQSLRIKKVLREQGPYEKIILPYQADKTFSEILQWRIFKESEYVRI